jgi:hypothetical protein
VVVETTIDAWARFLATPPPQRHAAQQGVDVRGTDRDIEHFTRLLARFPRSAG